MKKIMLMSHRCALSLVVARVDREDFALLTLRRVQARLAVLVEVGRAACPLHFRKEEFLGRYAETRPTLPHGSGSQSRATPITRARAQQVASTCQMPAILVGKQKPTYAANIEFCEKMESHVIRE